MKKILFIIISVYLFTCCTNDTIIDNDFINSPIVGIWNNYDSTNLLVNRKVYTKDHYTYFTMMNGSEVKNIDPQYYKISGNQILMSRYTQTFNIKKDTLWITNSSGNLVIKYIRFNNSLQ